MHAVSTCPPSATPLRQQIVGAGTGFLWHGGLAWIDAADLRAISFAFRFAVGLVLAAALAGDAYLIALARQIPATVSDIANRQLAADLLPWTGAFTMVALLGVPLSAGLRRLLDGTTARQGFRLVPSCRSGIAGTGTRAV